MHQQAVVVVALVAAAGDRAARELGLERLGRELAAGHQLLGPARAALRQLGRVDVEQPHLLAHNEQGVAVVDLGRAAQHAGLRRAGAEIWQQQRCCQQAWQARPPPSDRRQSHG
jgi:hypothetical protein